jgi:hypothetical protein
MGRVLFASMLLLVTLEFAVACGKSPVPGAARPGLATAAPSATAPPAPPAPASATASPKDVAGVRVESPFPGGVAIVNDGDAAVRIARDLPIERETNGTWTRSHGMTMTTRCFEPAPAGNCVEIAAHSTYAPLPWTGWIGCTQCASCWANLPAPPGRYRVVALECDGNGGRHEGPPMTLVSAGRFAKTPHVYAPPGEPSAIVVDNETDEPVSFRMAADVARLDRARGAYDTVEHAEMLLSPDCGRDAGADACVTVAAHGTLRSLPFKPGCRRCAKCPVSDVQPGTYMHTVTLCAGSKALYNEVYGTTFHTEPFVVDAHGAMKTEH